MRIPTLLPEFNELGNLVVTHQFQFKRWSIVDAVADLVEDELANGVTIEELENEAGQPARK